MLSVRFGNKNVSGPAERERKGGKVEGKNKQGENVQGAEGVR